MLLGKCGASTVETPALGSPGLKEVGHAKQMPDFDWKSGIYSGRIMIRFYGASALPRIKLPMVLAVIFI
jgi:hypothetical protein